VDIFDAEIVDDKREQVEKIAGASSQGCGLLRCSEPDVSLVAYFATHFVGIVAAHEAIQTTRVCFLPDY